MPSYSRIFHQSETVERQEQRYTVVNSGPIKTDFSKPKLHSPIRISDPSSIPNFPAYYYPPSHSISPNYSVSPRQEDAIRRYGPSRPIPVQHEETSRKQSPSQNNEPLLTKQTPTQPYSRAGSLSQDMTPRTTDDRGTEKTAFISSDIANSNNLKVETRGAPQHSGSNAPTFAKKILMSPNSNLPKYANLVASPTVPNSTTYGNYPELIHSRASKFGEEPALGKKIPPVPPARTVPSKSDITVPAVSVNFSESQHNKVPLDSSHVALQLGKKTGIGEDFRTLSFSTIKFDRSVFCKIKSVNHFFLVTVILF